MPIRKDTFGTLAAFSSKMYAKKKYIYFLALKKIRNILKPLSGYIYRGDFSFPRGMTEKEKKIST